MALDEIQVAHLNHRSPSASDNLGGIITDLSDRSVKVTVEPNQHTGRFSVQVRDREGHVLEGFRLVEWTLTDDEGVIVGTAPSGGVTAVTGQLLFANVADKSGLAMTNDAGLLVLDLTESGDATFYCLATCGVAKALSEGLVFVD